MLQKQTITIPLGLGVNTKTDEKLVEQGQFNLVSENATFAKVGAVQKRNAYDPLSTTYYDPYSNAGSGSGDYTSATYKPVSASSIGKGVLLRTQTGEYYYRHKSDFIRKDDYPIPECKVSSFMVYPGKTSVSQTDTDYDSDEDIVVAVARDGNPSGAQATIAGQGSTLVLFDNNKKTTITTAQAEATVDTNDYLGYVKCGYSRTGGSSYYYNVWVDSNKTMNIWTYNKYGQKYSTTHSISNVQAVTSNPYYGVIASCRSSDNSSCYFITAMTTAATAKFVAMSGTSKTYETTFSITGNSFQGAYAFYEGGLIYLYYGTGGTTRLVILNPNGTVNTADASYNGSIGSGVMGDKDDYTKLYSLSGGLIQYSNYNNASLTTQNNSYLESDKVTIGGVEMVLVRDQVSDTPSTYYALGVSTTAGYAGAKPVARLTPLTATNDAESICQFSPSRFAKIDDNTAVIALPRLTGNNGDNTTYSMQLVYLAIEADYLSYNRSTIGPNIHFQGGFVAEFDGEKMIENGFLGVQSAPSLDVSAAGTLTGTFSYCTVMRYIDKNGQITRSAPSLATSTGAINTKKVVITPDSMPYGVKAANCVIELYRTKTGPGTTFYYVGEVVADMYDTMPTYEDQAADSAIDDNTILYTDGNVLQNDPAPACKLVTQGGNRLFVAGLEDENEVGYSKKKLFGESVNFSDNFRIRFDSSQYNITGGITGIGYMDDKLISFKRNSIFYVAGDGPNELGFNDTFTAPELISSETGCTEPRSIVLTPMGLMFKGDKGIYLLNRGLATEYIGAPVESFNSYQVTSAVHLDKKNQVIFSIRGTDDSTQKYQLVYDYFTQQWSVYTGLVGIDGDVVDGDHLVLDATSSTPYVQGTDYLDNATAYSARVTTPWIKVSGIQDFGRIYSATIIGKYKSAHTLRVTAYYDYASDYSEVYDIAPSVSDSQYQYRIHLKKQKCEAVQFEIKDLSQTGTGESMELTALTLEVGLKKGSMKLPATRKY
jgi:hypothetical protein